MTISIADGISLPNSTNTPPALVGTIAAGQVAVATDVGVIGGSQDLTFADSLLTIAGNTVVPKTAGKGILVDTATPTFGWRDLEGPIRPKATGAGSPTLATFIGNIRGFWFTTNDISDLEFHMPHDYLAGSDLFIHIHWSHTGTTISGQLDVSYRWSYAKGHDQADFPSDTTLTQTVLTPNIGAVPQYRHRIDEVQLSAASQNASQIDSDLLEPDGLILISLIVTAIPTLGGGGHAFIHYMDIHYQSTNIGTKQKAPDFYT